jgi:hypothetical protein
MPVKGAMPVLEAAPVALVEEREAVLYAYWTTLAPAGGADRLVRDAIHACQRVQAFTSTHPASDLRVLRGRDAVRTAGTSCSSSGRISRRRHWEVGGEKADATILIIVVQRIELAYSTTVGSAACERQNTSRHTLP